MNSTIDPSRNSPDANLLLGDLEREIRGYDSLVIAFSGGVDSAVLLAASGRVLNDRAVALTADSPSMPHAELKMAQKLAAWLGLRHIVVPTAELDRPEYVTNDRQRCYWCKTTLFETCARVASELGIADVAYGYTADDAGDFRPGHAAAAEFHVRAPLFDAKLGKQHIRAIARLLGLPIWDKPAAPCLSSRIPYGTEVSIEKLGTIERMEALLHELGFAVIRARFDGVTMKIEAPLEQIPRLESPAVWSRVTALAEALGVNGLLIDREGFRSGKLNELVTFA